MRISDGSSDICSSDLVLCELAMEGRERAPVRTSRNILIRCRDRAEITDEGTERRIAVLDQARRLEQAPPQPDDRQIGSHEILGRAIEDRTVRSEERRVGKEWVGTCGSRWSPRY